MDAFPEFMKNNANRIARSNQATAGVEGYVVDEADESQMAFWVCALTATSAEHVYTLLIDGGASPSKLARSV